MTDPGNLRGFGTKDRPVILDISQLIRRVQWLTGPDILMIRIEESIRTGLTPSATIEQPIGYNGDVFANVIHDYDDHRPVAVVQLPTINADMVAHSADWNKAPLKKATEAANSWYALLFFNLKVLQRLRTEKLPEYEIKLRFPAGRVQVIPGTVYWAFVNLFGNGFQYAKDHPHTTGAIIDAEGHIGIVQNVLAFDQVRRDLFLGYNAGSLPPWEAFDEAVSDERNDSLIWKVQAWTFKRRKTFPVKVLDYAPDFPTNDDKVKDFHEITPLPIATPTIPAYTVTLRVTLKTLTFTLTKA